MAFFYAFSYKKDSRAAITYQYQNTTIEIRMIEGTRKIKLLHLSNSCTKSYIAQLLRKAIIKLHPIRA